MKLSRFVCGRSVGVVLGAGVVLGLSASGMAQNDDYGAYDSGDYGYSDPSPAPAPRGSSGKGILSGTPNFRYGYLEADYKWLSFSNDFIEDRSGYGVDLSLAGSGNAYLKASGLFSPAPEGDGGDESYFYGSVGPGFALPVGSVLDITIDGGLAYQKFDSVFSELGDGIGFYVTPGLRIGLGNNFEITGALRYSKIQEESGVAVNLGAHLYLTDNIVVVGSASFAEEINSYGIGLRVNF